MGCGKSKAKKVAPKEDDITAQVYYNSSTKDELTLSSEEDASASSALGKRDEGGIRDSLIHQHLINLASSTVN